MGGSITIAILNGGPPGVIYEFIAACFYYGCETTSGADSLNYTNAFAASSLPP